jgi:hypothetical protein
MQQGTVRLVAAAFFNSALTCRTPLRFAHGCRVPTSGGEDERDGAREVSALAA